MAIKDELLEQLLEGRRKPEDLLGDDGIFQELKKALVEKALGAELTHHLGYERGQKPSRAASNTRNATARSGSKAEAVRSRFASPGTGTAASSPS